MKTVFIASMIFFTLIAAAVLYLHIRLERRGR
jgi:hypothetical protein